MRFSHFSETIHRRFTSLVTESPGTNGDFDRGGMTSDPMPNVVVLFCAGFGLLMAAAANLGLRRRSIGLRLGASLFVIAATAGGARLVSGDAASAGPASAILAAILG